MRPVAVNALEVDIVPRQGPAGASVHLSVRASDPAAVHAVRVAVVGYGIEEGVPRTGTGWGLDVPVPWEAQPGEYLLDIYALDGSGARLAGARATFTVTA